MYIYGLFSCLLINDILIGLIYTFNLMYVLVFKDVNKQNYIYIINIQNIIYLRHLINICSLNTRESCFVKHINLI